MIAAVEILREARGLIEHRDKWIRQHDRLDDRYCMMGAIIAVGDGHDDLWRLCEDDESEVLAAVHALEQACGGDIRQFNDWRAAVHADVLAKFDEAIAALAPPTSNARRFRPAGQHLVERPASLANEMLDVA